MESLELINSKTRQAYNLVAQKYHDLFHNEMNEKEYDRKLIDSFICRFNEESVICDAGCGPSGHIGRYVFDKKIKVVGIDISDKCVELAKRYNSKMNFERGDISNLKFNKNSFDGIISYYSIINTPKKFVGKVFNEFHRVLKPNGYLLVAIKAGTDEGYIGDLLGIKIKIYNALFTKKEISNYFQRAKFSLEFIEKRNPYDFEISNERIFAIGKKV
jgi:ubiquinone/menaquinone biosynthesis C-methylase UbiE